MSNIQTRLKEFISSTGMSKNKFAEYIGTSSALMSKLTTEEVDFRKSILEKILEKFPDLNLTWLLTGHGNMVIEDQLNEVQYNPQTDEYLLETISKTKQSEYYKYTNEIASKILYSFYEDFRTLKPVLETHWELNMRFMQFINQYDCFLTPFFNVELFNKASSLKLSREDFVLYIRDHFNNIDRMIPVLERLNKYMADTLKKLKDFDTDQRIDSDDWKISLEADRNSDHATSGKFLATFNITGKHYPDL